VDTKGENPPGRAPRNDDEKTHVRWIPSIVDLAKRGFDERHRKISAVVSSVVHLPGGGKLASESVSKEIYDFSDPILRKVVDSHAMAERISYKLDFSKQDSIVLELAEGQNVTLKERPGEDLPLVVSNLPSASYSIEHFGLYYALLKPYGPMPQLPRGTVNQIQCGGSWITDPRPEHD
jgi:hypothetical protein